MPTLFCLYNYSFFDFIGFAVDFFSTRIIRLNNALFNVVFFTAVLKYKGAFCPFALLYVVVLAVVFYKGGGSLFDAVFVVIQITIFVG